jgi:biotin synthase
MESPEYIKLSLSGEMQLGFSPARFYRNAKMTCINLLLHYEEGCSANCQYCGLARERVGGAMSFIRVKWANRKLDEVIERIKQSKVVKRICISMITNKRAIEDTITITEKLVRETLLPVSILCSPTIIDKKYFIRLKEVGVDKIGIAFDLPTQDLFDKYRGRNVRGPHKWKKYWRSFSDAIEIFGEKNVGSHFIVGLGETEKEIVKAFQDVRDLGGVNHLFSFYPEKGSALENHPIPPMDKYRRIQIACELIDSGKSSYDKFRFNESGMIINFGVEAEELNAIIDSGIPFRTRGCIGKDDKVACNRPFANSLPGENIRNYPFELNSEDIGRIKKQLGISETPLAPLLTNNDTPHPSLSRKERG